MLKKYLLLFLPVLAIGQTHYYPPLNSDEWTRTDPLELGWCAGRVDSLLNFVETADTKAFVILKDGKIVVERYFGIFQQDSLWYWASAGKSLMGTLVGLAQQDGDLSITEPASKYLGEGWTNAPPEKEALITIRHQITMTTGLDDRGPNALDNCLRPDCLNYLADAGTRWAYYNAPYRLVQDVLEQATGQNKNVYTRQRLGARIGMQGFWFDYVYYSTARDMARFGHLILSRGVWDGDKIVQDQNYFNAMLSPSQELNPSYGYLWWLNGQSAFMLPGLQIVFQRSILPEAPADLVAALGKNDQKIYVVPSQGLVVVRQGNAAGSSSPAALSSFDNQLWEQISRLDCGVTSSIEIRPPAISVYPVPASDLLSIESDRPVRQLQLLDRFGRLCWVYKQDLGTAAEVALPSLPAGLYFLRLESGAKWYVKRVILK